MGTGGPLPGGKARPGREADHSPHLVPRLRMSRSYTPLPLVACMAVAGQLYFGVLGSRSDVYPLSAHSDNLFVLLYFSRSSIKAAFTRCKFARGSHVPGMRRQTFHASRIMAVVTHFKVQPAELPIICMKRLRAHPRYLTRASKLASCKCGLSLPEIENHLFRLSRRRGR